jgi:hypothetical protein
MKSLSSLLLFFLSFLTFITNFNLILNQKIILFKEILLAIANLSLKKTSFIQPSLKPIISFNLLMIQSFSYIIKNLFFQYFLINFFVLLINLFLLNFILTKLFFKKNFLRFLFFNFLNFLINYLIPRFTKHLFLLTPFILILN